MSGARQILIVEDNPISSKVMRVTLEADGFEVVEARDARTALAWLESGRPDLVVQDFVLPDLPGDELAKRIRAASASREVPIVLVTGFTSSGPEPDQFAVFDAVLVKPVEPARLIQAVRGLLGAASNGARRSGRILVVDDDPTNRKLVSLRLEHVGYEVSARADGVAALDDARRSPPRAILADVLMPGLDGFRLCAAVRADPALAHVPVVLVTASYDSAQDRDAALAAGASDLVPRTPSLEEAIAALDRAIEQGPPPIASPVAEDPAYLDSLRRQVERQLSQNRRLAERTTVQAAALSMIGALAQTLARPRDIGAALADTLLHCLDATGLSTGVLYLRGAEGRLELHSVAGLPEAARAEAERGFGHPELLEPRDGGGPRALGPDGESDAAAREFLRRLGCRSALVVGFELLGRHYGSLVLASTSLDLSDPAWQTFGAALAAQFGQTLALGRAIAATTEREQRFRQLAENIKEVFWIVDAQYSEMLYINPSYERIWGRTCASLHERPQSFLDGVLEEDRPALMENIARIRRGEEPGELQFRVLQPGGQVRWVQGNAVPVRDEEGRVYRIAGVALDVTERKLAEESVRAAERRSRALFDTVELIVVGLDSGGRLEYVNPYFQRLTGWTEDEILGRDWFDRLPPAAERDERRAAFREALARGEPWRRRAAIVTREGASRTIDWYHTVVRDPSGSTSGSLSVGEDVTGRLQLEQQFQHAQKMEAVGRLAGGVAHDFNNLLTVILGYGELALLKTREGDPLHHYLEEICTACTRATALTRQLLAFSRQQVLAPRQLDVNDLVQGLEKMLRRLLGEDVALSTRFGTGLGTVHADAGQIEQVIVNLAVNARDAMPNGGELKISTAAVEGVAGGAAAAPDRAAAAFVEVSLADSGTGMSEETKRRIFEPFYTTKELGKGTGLGLSTVYGIVEQSGGFVEVDSEVGKGSVFRVYLPSSTKPAEASRLRVAAVSGSRGHETVLIVEDEDALRSLAEASLTSLGYRVVTAANGGEALMAFEESPSRFDLVVTDVVMPGAGGRQLAERLRRIRPDLRVLFMSGYADRSGAWHDEAAADGCYLEKPFTPDALQRKVRELLDRPAR